MNAKTLAAAALVLTAVALAWIGDPTLDDQLDWRHDAMEEVLVHYRAPALTAAAKDRLAQWEGLFGSGYNCLLAADREPALYELLALELELGEPSGDARELRTLIGKLNPLSPLYEEQLECLLQSVPTGRLIRGWPASDTPAHRLRLRRLDQALGLWLDGATPLDAKRSGGPGERAVDDIYLPLGEPDAVKRRAVRMLRSRLARGDLPPLAPADDPTVSCLRDAIAVLEPDHWAFETHLKEVLTAIGRKRVPTTDDGIWSSSLGPAQRLRHRISAAVDELDRWLAEVGPADPADRAAAERVWLGRCLLETLRHHLRTTP